MAKQMDDIQLEQDDLKLAAGDFLIMDGAAEHQRQLLLNNKGDFKESPTVCVGAFTYIEEEQIGTLLRAIKTEFARDGMTSISLSISQTGVINSDATYQ